MDKPIKVSFRNMDRSESIAAAIERKSSQLERLHDHIIDIHVIVRSASKRHQKGAGMTS